MFTGIVTDIGRVRSVQSRGVSRFRIACAYDTGTIEIGASIACSGVCLTAVDKGEDWFAVEASHETLSCTTLGTWAEGTPVNLERALRVGDELGGHIVTGHVDGTATLLSQQEDGDLLRLTFQVADDLSRYIASKGSVALDGVSLTVNQVDKDRFGVNIIPYTRSATTFGSIATGSFVNLEVDVLARYVARYAGREAE